MGRIIICKIIIIVGNNIYPRFLDVKEYFLRTFTYILSLRFLAHQVLRPVYKENCVSAGCVMIFYGDLKFTLLDIKFFNQNSLDLA